MTTQSALIQLASAGVQDASMNRETRNAQVNVQYSFQNNELILPRGCDTITPLFIKSNNPISFLELEIGGCTIIKFPLNFCNTLSNFTSVGNLYKIPCDLLNLKSIPLVSLHYHQVKFIIISSYQDGSARLYACNYYLEDSQRRIFANRFHENIIKQFQEQEIHIDSLGNNNQLHFHGLIKGIFLDNISIDIVNSIQLLFQDNPRFTYDKQMIQLFTKKISDTCIYIPFDNQDFNDLSLNSCINFSRLASIAIKITCDTDVSQDIIVRAFNHNILRIGRGMGGLAYELPIPSTTNTEGELNLVDNDLSVITHRVNTHNRTNSNSGELNLVDNDLSVITHRVNTHNRTNSNSGELNLVNNDLFGITHRVNTHNNNSITVATVNKVLEGDSLCSISLTEIESEAEYMTCNTCHKNFIATNLQRWLTENNNCPTCRIIWTTERTIYINI
jgi:hypothetical protein